MVKTFITYLLSILFLIGTFHLDLQSHTYTGDYAICEISCDDNEHHSSPHLCEKCLNKNHRLVVPDYNDFLSNFDYRQKFIILNHSLKNLNSALFKYVNAILIIFNHFRN